MARKLQSAPLAMERKQATRAAQGRMVPGASGSAAASSERRGGVGVDKAQIAASVDDTRAELARTLEELRSAMRQQLDWRAWVRRRPLLCLGLAAFVGFRLARMRW